MRGRLVSLVMFACLNADLAAGQQLEFKMISSGANRPAIALWNLPMRQIMAGLHADMTPEQLAVVLGLSRAALAATIDSLRAEGVIHGVDGVPRPSCMVVSADEGASLTALAADVARKAMPFMRQAVADVRARYQEIPGLKHLAFDDVSLFLISDVLLDNWQIGVVERRWLKAERPSRGRSRYYCAIFARADRDREAFDIFGNQVTGLPDGRLLGVYGNRRGGPGDLSSLPQARLAALADLSDTADRAALVGRVVDRLQHMAGTRVGADLPPRFTTDLQAMGLVRQGRPVFAVLDTTDGRRLDSLAATLSDSLISFLEAVTPQLRATWTSSRWHAETTFEEFRIWWYHFFYTALTERLAADGAILIPETGLFHYVMLP